MTRVFTGRRRGSGALPWGRVTTMNTFTPTAFDDDVETHEEAPPAKPVAARRVQPKAPRGGLYDKIEAFVSRLSMRDNFWNAICSLIWLPLAFFSGLRMKEVDENTFAARAILP